MKDENLSVLQPFILNWNLRNIHSNSSPVISDEFSITGSCIGEYPIDGWIPYILEIPKGGHKRDLSGRFSSANYTGRIKQKFNKKRAVSLPIYSESENYDIDQLKIIVNNWNDIGIPDDIPCIAIAIKYSGLSSDFRESQHVNVLIIWSDAVARIVTLEWFEGPLEDCITPEWYINSSSLLNLKTALLNYGKDFKHISLDGITYSIYTIPMCFGALLNGKNVRASEPNWNCEWKYDNYLDFDSDLNLLYSEIQGIFFETHVR